MKPDEVDFIKIYTELTALRLTMDRYVAESAQARSIIITKTMELTDDIKDLKKRVDAIESSLKVDKAKRVGRSETFDLIKSNIYVFLVVFTILLSIWHEDLISVVTRISTFFQ